MLTVGAKILVVDDHVLFRHAFIGHLKNFITDEILQAADGAEAIAILASTPVAVLFLDISMPGMDGYDCFDIVKRDYPATKIIMLSQHDDIPLIMHFISKGTHAYMTKKSNPYEIIEAIRSVTSGNNYFPPSVMAKVQNSLADMKKEARRVQVSPQEKSLLQFLKRGLTSKQIAGAMKISLNTVNFYRENLLMKTGTKNVAELMVFASENALL